MVKYRIQGIEAFFITFCALIVDALTLIPFVGTFTGWIFWIFFYMYFILIKGTFPKIKNLLTGIVSSAFELVPILQMFPTITGGVIMIIANMRKEDRKSAKLNSSLEESVSSNRNNFDKNSSNSRYSPKENVEEVPVQ